MPDNNLKQRLQQHFGEQLELRAEVRTDMVSLLCPPEELVSVCTKLRDHSDLDFAQLSDLCGVDYSAWGQSDWQTTGATTTGFSRSVQTTVERDTVTPPPVTERFAVVYHLLSLQHNWRLRLYCCPQGEPPRIASVTSVWASANWYEREAFDLFGIMFDGHNDLRRILTDYGFNGHPLRKDFPMVGEVEVRYDPEEKKVVNQPVSIEDRVLVPRVIRHDNSHIEGGGDDGEPKS
ncbi:MAG: NADH-quinone oxidoreductase subunit C [Candidatus Porifericomitaceae bacterium WSBS_2022_MAG_OTU9]